MPIKRIIMVASVLAQCLALSALTGSDLSLLDAAFEATFRKGPLLGIAVWEGEGSDAIHTRPSDPFRLHRQESIAYT